MKLAVGFRGTDFSQMTPTKLKKTSSYRGVSSQDLSLGLFSSRDFSVVGLKKQLEAKSSIFVNWGIEL